jgi:hypothetical protein
LHSFCITPYLKQTGESMSIKDHTSVYFCLAVLIVTLYSFIIFSDHTYAWSNDPKVNTSICTSSGNQLYPTIISDGSGGAIITWLDWRNGSYTDIYAQRLNESGITQWTANGVAICTASGHQQNPTLISDGSGGAIITWEDWRYTADIYAQRINASGDVKWTPNGEAITFFTNDQQNPQITPDGSGGAIITWEDSRLCGSWDNYADIYTRRITASGIVQWAWNGEVISDAEYGQYNPTLISDGSGGAIITWQDSRWVGWNIYAQRINANGIRQWTPENGLAICRTDGSQAIPTITSDGSGGAIITWQDGRNGNYDIYAQRINASGILQWTWNGKAICTASGNQLYPTIISDGSGGAIITWEDLRSGISNHDIYAQRVTALGVPLWTLNGVAICTTSGSQYNPTLTSDDGAGGAIITWTDYRNGYSDIYAQRINRDGTLGETETSDTEEVNALPWLFLLLDE